jgi:C4-type Zn-finger protein
VPVFLKKCPSCGKRFEVTRTSESVQKKVRMASAEESSFSSPMSEGMVEGGVYPVGEAEKTMNSPTIEVEVPVEEDIYTETYTCKHCGHVWSETNEKDKVIGRDSSSTTVGTVRLSDE